MSIQYALFWLTVCLLQSSLLYLLNIITFRASGKVIGYQFKVGSGEYKKYQKRTGTIALLITALTASLLCALVVVQFWTVARKHVPGSTHTMVVGGLLTLGLGFWVVYKMSTTFKQMSDKNRPASSGGRHGKDDSWLV